MVLSFYDLLFAPFLLFAVYVFANNVRKKNERKQPLYKWYAKGLMVKFFGAIGVCLVYQLYYTGGDTVNYFTDASALVNLFLKNPTVYFDIVFNNECTYENASCFGPDIAVPFYFYDAKAMTVVRLISPIVMLSFNTFIPSAIILAWICYSGIWRLFLIFNMEYPELEKQFAISILFIPSVVFWGSGLLKDTITLSAVGWYTYGFYWFFIKKKYDFKNLIFVLVASILLISIKPYILFALLPGSIVWLSNEKLVNVKSPLIRFIAGPFFIGFGIGLGFFILTLMGESLGVYAVDNVLNKALVTNLDQKSEYYGGNSFDIGYFEPTPSGVASKAHLAIFATLFRPTLLDAKNPVMLMSALENAYILLLTIFLMFKLKLFGFFRFIGDQPLLLFSVTFALFFAFSVGIATSNFGTLVRLKIPCIPFYVSSLFVLKHLYEKKFKKKLRL